MKKLLSANEAVAHAAAQAGCAVASAYPGTPSTEILENVAKFKDVIRCEWAVNEKVAMETAIGASMAGARALTAMKHVGLNVAMDPLMTFTYVGATGGMVIVSADDPGMHSSQNEQDNRNLAKFARAPLFEPADSQEAYDMTLAAFEVSERFRVPAIIRLTTRTSHSSTLVELGAFAPARRDLIPYKKDITRNIPVPMFARGQRLAAQKRTEALSAAASESPLNKVFMPADGASKPFGIVTSAVAFQYVREIFPDFPVLKLGWTNPLPKALVRDFASKVAALVVVEELDPFLEEQLRAMGLKVLSHETELNMLELNADRVQNLRHELVGDVEAAKAVLRAAGDKSAGGAGRPAVLVVHPCVHVLLASLVDARLDAFEPARRKVLRRHSDARVHEESAKAALAHEADLASQTIRLHYAVPGPERRAAEFAARMVESLEERMLRRRAGGGGTAWFRNAWSGHVEPRGEKLGTKKGAEPELPTASGRPSCKGLCARRSPPPEGS